MDNTRRGIFDGDEFEDDSLIDKYCTHYSTWEEAEAGHYAVVALIRNKDASCF